MYGDCSPDLFNLDSPDLVNLDCLICWTLKINTSVSGPHGFWSSVPKMISHETI